MVKSRILFCFILILSIIFVIAYPGRMSYVTLYSIAGLFVFAMLSAYAAKYFIKIEEIFEKKFVFKNEEFNYCLKVHNKSIFAYPRIKFSFYDEDFASYTKPGELAFSMSPSQAEELSYSVNFKFRGVYKIGVRHVSIMDFLGLFNFKYSLNNNEVITVYPDREEDFSLMLKEELLNKALSNFDLYKDQYADVSDIRKYEPADDFKKIHWKLTAKKNEFMVKNYQSTALNKTIVLLNSNNILKSSSRSLFDSKPGGADTTKPKAMEKILFEDKIVSKAASAVYFCFKKKLPVEFIYGFSANEQTLVDSSEDLNRVYHILAELNFIGESDFSDKIEAVLSNEEGFFNIILLTTDFDYKLYGIIKKLFTFGHHIIIFYFKPYKNIDLDSENYFKELSAAGAGINII